MTFDGLLDPPSVEAQACNEALALATDLNLRKVVIASDCLKVVSNINKGSASIYAPVLNEIHYHMNEFEEVCFRYEARESNSEAHDLAKASTTIVTGSHLWLGVMPDIICIPDTIVIQ